MEDLTKKQIATIKKIQAWEAKVKKWVVDSTNAVALNKTIKPPPKPPPF
jgi:hypothetical protein